MPLFLQENVSLKNYSTFGIGGIARYFARLEKVEDLESFSKVVKEKKLQMVLIGKGSNIIFADGLLDIVVGEAAIRGIDIVDEDELSVTIQIGGGEVWDDVVRWASSAGYAGIEALAAIPGTAGATPVQNVGAYGQEIQDTFVELYAYDQQTEKFITLRSGDCKFAYRSSIFNTTEKGRYLIANVTLKLSKLPPSMPHYPGVEEHLKAKGIISPTSVDISNAITEIRWSKLPKPSEVGNAGSFFKNTFVSKERAEELKKQFSDIKLFNQPDGQVKIPSGWLIEKAGFKGKNFGTISVYNKNALVLVNNGNATFEELMVAREEICRKVKESFQIELEQEPLLIQ